MNAITLYLAAANAAAESQGKPNTDEIIKAAFKNTGLTAQGDYAVFCQHLNYFNGVMATLANTQLPSQIARDTLAEI